MTARNPAKRIPTSIRTETKLLGTYTLSDLAVALFPGVCVVLTTQLLLPSDAGIAGVDLQAFALPLAGLAIGLGALFVYLTPAYTTSLDWLGTFLAFQRMPGSEPHAAATAYTRVECIHPRHDAIERTDGTLVGAVHVDSASLALATDEQWRSTADAFQEFLNTVVEFPIQIYSTTRSFPVEDHLAHYEARLEDADVKANPQLAALIETYLEWYATDLAQRRTAIRDHYVLIPVSPDEVQFERESLFEQLARLPVLGIFIEVWLAPDRAEGREAMIDALEERRRRVEQGLRELEGCSARRLSSEELTQVVAEFWSGTSLDELDLTAGIRTQPIASGGRR